MDDTPEVRVPNEEETQNNRDNENQNNVQMEENEERIDNGSNTDESNEMNENEENEGEEGEEDEENEENENDENEEEEEDEDNNEGNDQTIMDLLLQSLVTRGEDYPEDNHPINFDTSLPSIHQYLGDVDLVPVVDVGLLSHGHRITVPIFSFPHVVLFPGETLPLLLTELPQSRALQALVDQGETLIAVANSHFKSDVVSVAEIRYRKKSNGGGDDEILIAIGKHRMKMDRVKHIGGKLMATGCIFEDAPTRIPMEARRNMTFYSSAIWKLYDAKLLMKTARKLAHFIEEGVNDRTENMDPTQYSFWLARNMPFQDNVRHALLEKNSTQDRLKLEISLLQQFSDISCKQCRAILSNATHILNMSTEGSLGAYVNAHGHIFETLTVKRVTRNVFMDHSPPSTDQSWFPGYAWTIMYCAGCFGHLGWRYDAVDKDAHPRVFWGLRRAALG